MEVWIRPTSTRKEACACIRPAGMWANDTPAVPRGYILVRFPREKLESRVYRHFVESMQDLLYAP